MALKIRNICTIAHVDHGKTTLVDGSFRQSGTFAAHKILSERMMDSNELEQERGITIAAKNAAFMLGETKINIVDTPGHADFGGEVERIMNMVDGAILLVDAAEGPLPQTRFVLSRAIAKGLKVIVCINKVDRPEVRGCGLIDDTLNKIFDLFVELGASDEQCEFPVVYACARDGWCTIERDQIEGILATGPQAAGATLAPLFQLILNVPGPEPVVTKGPFMTVSHITYSEFVSTCALGRVYGAPLKKNMTLYRHGINKNQEPMKEKFTLTSCFSYRGMEQVQVEEIGPGDIGLISGLDSFAIGDTIGVEDEAPAPRIKVEAPTMRMIFSVNTSPFSGKEGKPLQSRELGERLYKETRVNPSLKMDEADAKDQFFVYGRGELQFGILIESLRREGYEFMVGKPAVVMREGPDGGKLEPFERIIFDVLEIHTGEVTKLYQERAGVLCLYENAAGGSLAAPRVRLTMEIPTRGILGTKSQFLTATRGAGIMASEYLEHRPYVGTISHRINGSIIADREGPTTAYALMQIQERGSLFIGEAVLVYEGMIIGECSRDQDLNVNAVRPKKLTNVRSTSSEGITILHGTKKMSLEACLEWINDDEWIEVTPQNVRLRKKVLAANLRPVKKREE